MVIICDWFPLKNFKPIWKIWPRHWGDHLCCLIEKNGNPQLHPSLVYISFITSHVFMVKSSQISPDLQWFPGSSWPAWPIEAGQTMETIGKTWKSEMSEMRKKVVSHGINIFLGPVILYTLVRRNSTFHEDCLSIPCMTPIPWLKLPLCLQINSVPPQARPLWCQGGNTMKHPDLKSFPQNRQIIASHWRFLFAGGDDNWGY